jgi:hypothetical protein
MVAIKQVVSSILTGGTMKIPPLVRVFPNAARATCRCQDQQPPWRTMQTWRRLLNGKLRLTIRNPKGRPVTGRAG